MILISRQEIIRNSYTRSSPPPTTMQRKRHESEVIPLSCRETQYARTRVFGQLGKQCLSLLCDYLCARAQAPCPEKSIKSLKNYKITIHRSVFFCRIFLRVKLLYPSNRLSSLLHKNVFLQRSGLRNKKFNVGFFIYQQSCIELPKIEEQVLHSMFIFCFMYVHFFITPQFIFHKHK